jgi:hypothetical protein
MARTSFIKGYTQRISAFMDQLWYFMFISEEFNKQLNKYSANARELFTVDIFEDNQYASRIHVKVRNLLAHEEKNQKINYGSTLSSIYEIGANYLEQLCKTLTLYNALPNGAWSDSRTPEKNLSRVLTTNGLLLPQQELLDTLSYVRLRRNHFTHIMPTPNLGLTNLIATRAAALNAKWKTPGIVTHDFSSVVNVSEFELMECIELMKIFLISLQEIDQHVASVLNSASVLTQLATDIFGDPPVRINNEIVEKRVRKLISNARTQLQLTVTVAQCEPIARAVGVR